MSFTNRLTIAILMSKLYCDLHLLHFLQLFVFFYLLLFSLLGLKLDLASEILTPSPTEFRICPSQPDLLTSGGTNGSIEWTTNSLLHHSKWEEEEKIASDI